MRERCRAPRTDKRGLVPEGWIAVLDSHDTALDGGSTGAEAAGLPVQCPFGGKIRLLLRDAQTGKSEKDSAGDTCSNRHPCAPQSWIDPPILPHYLSRTVTTSQFDELREIDQIDSLSRFRRFRRGWRKEILKSKRHRHPKAAARDCLEWNQGRNRSK